jgi:aspartokinase-like uncharacterized kinase
MYSPVVVKVGGSLFELDELATRLGRFLETLAPQPVVLVPGGGSTANLVRDLDRRHRLGEEASHWLALRALGLNAWFLASVLPSAGPAVVESLADCPPLWRQGQVAILDAHAFARADDGRPDHLPHAWAVTSDSVAARVAVVAGARELVLLKSVTIPEGMDWAEAGRRGLVDRCFAEVVKAAPAVTVRAINFRDWRREREVRTTEPGS